VRQRFRIGAVIINLDVRILFLEGLFERLQRPVDDQRRAPKQLGLFWGPCLKRALRSAVLSRATSSTDSPKLELTAAANPKMSTVSAMKN